MESDPAIAQHVTDEIKAIEELRENAGVRGQSTQPVYIDSRRTLYSTTGDWFAWTLVACTAFGFIAQGVTKLRGARTDSVRGEQFRPDSELLSPAGKPDKKNSA